MPNRDLAEAGCAGHRRRSRSVVCAAVALSAQPPLRPRPRGVRPPCAGWRRIPSTSTAPNVVLVVDVTQRRLPDLARGRRCPRARARRAASRARRRRAPGDHRDLLRPRPPAGQRPARARACRSAASRSGCSASRGPEWANFPVVVATSSRPSARADRDDAALRRARAGAVRAARRDAHRPVPGAQPLWRHARGPGGEPLGLRAALGRRRGLGRRHGAEGGRVRARPAAPGGHRPLAAGHGGGPPGGRHGARGGGRAATGGAGRGGGAHCRRPAGAAAARRDLQRARRRRHRRSPRHDRPRAVLPRHGPRLVRGQRAGALRRTVRQTDSGAEEPAFETAYRGRNRVLEIRLDVELERFRSVQVDLLEGITASDGEPLAAWSLSRSSPGADGTRRQQPLDRGARARR